jgi:cystathionine beta-lyase/cystathionine gamma-synthase
MSFFDTDVVHAGFTHDKETGAILTPIHQTATYVLEEVGKLKGYDYTRSSNPTRETMERHLAALENVRYGVAFASGMSAVDACFRLLKSGDHIVCSDDVYGGVSRLLDRILAFGGITVSYVNTSDVELVDEAVTPATRMIWVETPTNPLLKVSDLRAISEIAKRKGVLFGVDSTFATPALLKPAELGADIVLHSTSKYISGHNQLIGGVVLTDSDELHDRLRFQQKSIGAVPSPFDCWLTILGVKTLSLRMERHCSNAMEVAKFLESRSEVASVSYPGLPSHPQHQIVQDQMAAGGGMISFELQGGLEAGKNLLRSLRLCALAESLGAVETMITHPASMTHVDVPREERIARGLTDGMIRLSVGIEDYRDIIADLGNALDELS